MKLYHKSNPKNRDSILALGLLPSMGPSYSAHYDGRLFGPVIFLCEHKNYDTTYDDDLWEVDMQRLTCLKDEDVYGGFYYDEIIYPERLKLIYKGTGRSLF